MSVNYLIAGLVNYRVKNIRKTVAPGLCHLCQAPLDKSGWQLCAPCLRDLPGNDPACPGCALPGISAGHCAKCLVSSQPSITRATCVYRYAYPVNKLILDMKFHTQPGLARVFGQALADHINTMGSTLPQYIIPVPLHASRLGQRGYNQSLEIARHISSRLGIPVDHQCLKRIRKTLTQSELPASERKRNIRGAFSVNMPALSRYKHVAIIDDVITTGATVNELARVLLKAGVDRIDVWACARATLQPALA